MKKISLLGSTGSIGVNTLDVVERNPESFQILAMSAGSNVDLFVDQIRKFKPKVVALFDTAKISSLKERIADLDVEVLSGEEGAIAVATTYSRARRDNLTLLLLSRIPCGRPVNE